MVHASFAVHDVIFPSVSIECPNWAALTTDSIVRKCSCLTDDFAYAQTGLICDEYVAAAEGVAHGSSVFAVLFAGTLVSHACTRAIVSLLTVYSGGRAQAQRVWFKKRRNGSEQNAGDMNSFIAQMKLRPAWSPQAVCVIPGRGAKNCHACSN